jgi:threonine dehydrogenase-like Zn-dependent dehydrogenase
MLPTGNQVVVGAGPAGLMAVGCLLDLGARAVVWIDPEFRAGRLSQYAEVPRFLVFYLENFPKMAKYLQELWENRLKIQLIVRKKY